MYYLLVVCAFWLAAVLGVDWHRLQELLPAALTAILLTGIPTAIPGLDPPYLLVDIGPLTNHWALIFLLQFGLAPVLALWYAQGLQAGSRLSVGRWIVFALIPLAVEVLAVLFGRVVYASWWGPVNSLALYLFFGWVVYLVQTHIHACGSPQHQVDRSVREVNSPLVLPPPGSSDLARRQVDP